jgi:uncharacterized GH25 family protein
MLHPNRLLAAFALTLLSGPALAHDMWLEPSTFMPIAGDVVSIRLRVGVKLLGDPLPRDPKLVRDFVVEEGGRERRVRKPVVGRDGGDPAGFVRPTSGLAVVGYQSHPSVVDMTADKFNQYLAEEGLDAIVAERTRRQLTGSGAKDLFMRCAKALLYTSAASGAQDRPLGFELELVAEKNPYETSGDVPIRLTFQNRPLAGALVVAINRLRPDDRVTARTDAAGRVRFHFAPGGLWLVKAVHMVAAADRTQADWASYWASLTFEAGAPRVPKVPSVPGVP